MSPSPVRSRRARIVFALALSLPLALAGCCGPEYPDAPPGDHPVGPVFLCHGSWPDFPYWWTDDMAEALRARGIEAVLVPYFVLSGIGTGAPAERIAAFEAKLRWRHARTECRAPLRLAAVGYSSGTDVVLESAMAGAVYERVYFGGSPLALWNQDVERALVRGRIKRLVNYFSPFDGLVWITLGSGVYGYHAGGSAQHHVDNRVHFWLHVTPLFRRDTYLEEVSGELAACAGLRHTCYDDADYRAWYVAARERLRTDW